MTGKLQFRKVQGKHRMFNPELKRKVVLGPGQPDGDIVEFYPGSEPSKHDQSWERIGKVEDVAKAEIEEATSPGSLEIVDEGHGWYSVLNTATGENINTNKLRKEEVEALVTSYQLDDDDNDDDNDDDDDSSDDDDKDDD